MSQPESQDARIANLEITIAHQQRDYDTLNSVVTEYAEQIDRLVRTVRQLQTRLSALEASMGDFRRGSSTGVDLDRRSPEEDRPPHY